MSKRPPEFGNTLGELFQLYNLFPEHADSFKTA
jgi:hypothetical protein